MGDLPQAPFANPINDIIREDSIGKALNDIARVYFSNSDLSINLLTPVLLISLIALTAFGVLTLLGVDVTEVITGTLGGLTGSSSSLSSAYSAEYEVSPGHAAPSTGYGSYQARGDPGTQARAIAELQEKVAALKDDSLFSFYYNNPGVEGVPATSALGYTA